MNKTTRFTVAAVAVLMTWVFAGSVSAKPEYAAKTGKKCADCHAGAPKKDNLTDAGKTFLKCFTDKKDAAACK